MESRTYLVGKYFQKSLNYLYPLLGIDKDADFPPSTYLWWGKEESIDTNRLLVVYDKTSSVLYTPFEKKILFGNPYYEKCYELEDGKAYVFNLSTQHETVDKFIRGKYSQFSEGVKKRILAFHGASTDKSPRPGRHIHASLYPELYFDKVAEEINVTVDLQQVGELVDPPEKKRETISLKIRTGQLHLGK